MHDGVRAQAGDHAAFRVTWCNKRAHSRLRIFAHDIFMTNHLQSVPLMEAKRTRTDGT